MGLRRSRVIADLLADLDVRPGTSHRAIALRVCQVMRDRLGAPLEVRFVPMADTRLSGVTTALADGSYLVVCADSPRWYHRLHVLVHELAHVVLGHDWISFSRSGFTDPQEREAEEFADAVLAELLGPEHSREPGW
ncbi:hypothetical protein GCM10010174_29430 [Kutzneria viridogrisea]|uniref:Uncharacterized protein n=2 Tax=Kutzneria TaxID=43356 RepID=W5WBJ1_9PSEU|nr:ImmA/IrrE family metallo-endopeptidase [Kutzneria albida]AHH97911.1 hypothetical protein KALB_4549 [Kutzneria albida DSM 43870]MBA8924436.1 hypothetical protein [Kutzneria viridogrisea]